ncbi:AT-hook motif nuclear-localized protein 1 [Lactuca sativa]|uniref:AT-hook motif nuclear-localized protein n=1 Tax=Lactuca sativa TaxID=4236 RepID=A0A9R1W4Q4_LACSA|nr:AT-hook motif nuclear-localized protein 1 [Lactuca sativa]KAJ0217348.1 hypothetical protein LSAT_V11C300153980 [Lactuca sativa]
MDSRQIMMPSVEATKPEAPTPSNYQLALMTDNQTQTMGPPPPGFSPATGGNGSMPSSLAKKKRGRPRKYGPDGVATAASGGGSVRTLSPLPLSSASSPTSGGYSDVKFGELAGSGGEFQTEKKQKKKRINSSEKLNMSLGDQITSGGSFTPHMVTVNPGEDVTSKIISLTQYGPRAICVLSALGIISHVTLRQASSSGGTVTYEGRFEILSLSGSFTPGEVEGISSREGGMSIALSSPDGRVVGGLLGGILTAAGPVQVVVASFLPELGTTVGPKRKKQKNIIMEDPINNMDQNLNEKSQESPLVGNDDSTPTLSPAPNNFQHHENRASMPTVHVHDWNRTSVNLNEQRQRQESPMGENDNSTPTLTPDFHHEKRTSMPTVHDWNRTSMNLNEQRQRQEIPMGENDDSTPTPTSNFHHEKRTSMPTVHDWNRTSMNLNEQRQRERDESHVGGNDGSTPAPNFQHERASVHDWRRAVTDMNVSFRED